MFLSFILLVKDEYKTFDSDNNSSVATKSIEELIADAVKIYLEEHPVKIDIITNAEIDTLFDEVSENENI